MADTTTVYDAFASKFAAALSVIAPVAASSVNSAASAPDSEYTSAAVSPASGSVAVATASAPGAAFSVTVNVWLVTPNDGASFTSVTETVTVPVPVSPTPPSSTTATVRVYTFGTPSKFSPDGFTTLITPVAASIANTPVESPAVIDHLVLRNAAGVVSGSVRTTVPTTVPATEFSAMLNDCAATAGASFTFVTVTVTVPDDVIPAPSLSLTDTVSVYTLRGASKLSPDGFTTLIAPVAVSIENTPVESPAVIAHSMLRNAAGVVSGSVRTTVPTAVPAAEFSAMLNAWLAIAGASFTFVTVTVTVPDDVSPVPLPSVTDTVSVYTFGTPSKSSPDGLTTLIAPVAASIANTPVASPAVIAHSVLRKEAGVVSGSVRTTVPTRVPATEFSATLNACAATAGASFTFVTVTVTVLLFVDASPAASLADTTTVYDACASKFAAALSVIAPVAALSVNSAASAPDSEYTSVAVSPASGSVAVATASAPGAAFSTTVKPCAVVANTGASFTSVTVTVTVPDDVIPDPLPSVTDTVSVYTFGTPSKLSPAALATEIAPDAASIENTPPPFPPVISHAVLRNAAGVVSGSVRTTVPTAVPATEFSAMLNAWLAIAGASFTFVTVTVTAPDDVNPVPLPSVTDTVSVYTFGTPSKSSPDGFTTLIAPLTASIANTPVESPAVIAHSVLTKDAGAVSGSVRTTVPTAVPATEFSATLNDCAATAGASFTFVTVTVTVPEDVKPAPSLSLTDTVSVYTFGAASKSSPDGFTTLITPVAVSIENTPVESPAVIAHSVLTNAAGRCVRVRPRTTVPTAVPGMLSSRRC